MKLSYYKKSSLCACALLTAFTNSLVGQELEKVLPEPVPQLVEGPEPVDYRAEAEKFRRDFLGATGEEQVLVSELKGVIFLIDDSELDSIQLTKGENSNLGDFPEWNQSDFQTIVSTFVGLPVSKESLDRLRLSIRFHLSELGKPFSLVYTPPQDITDGVVQIVIRESRIGEIRVQGAEYFSEESYLARINQKSGEPINAQALNDGLDRINRNSFRNAVTRVEKGSEPATTDIVIQARERRPIRVFAGYNNTGSLTTNEDRLFAGLNWGNAFGLAHQMTLQWTSDPESLYSKSISGNYTADLWHNHSATLFGAYSETQNVPNSEFEQAGTSWQTGINYDIPLTSINEHYSHNLQLGFDYKSSDDNFDIILPPFIIPVSNNQTNVAQFRAKYRGTLQDTWGSTSWGIKLTASPGGLGSNNDDDAFSTTRAFAKSDYIYANLDTFRSTILRGFLEGYTWNVRGELQISNRNLLGSEQFSAGGSGTVRGYEGSEVVGDNALFLSQEFLLPAWDTTIRLPNNQLNGTLSTFVFQDYARTWNVDKLPGEKPFQLHSMGVGLRFQIGQNVTSNFAYGWQLRDSGSSDSGDNSRAHISLQFSY